MHALFFLDSPISAIAKAFDPTTDSLRTEAAQGVSAQVRETLSAIRVYEQATVAETCRLLLASRTQHPGAARPEVILLVDDHDAITGSLDIAVLIAGLLDIADNQSILLDTLLDSMSEATTVVNSANTVLFWNEAAENIYDISRTEVIGTSLDVHFASESLQLKDALAQGTAVYRRYHIPRPDRHVLINSAPIRKNGQIIGAISIEQDITELVRLNEELVHTTAHLHTLQQEMNRVQGSDDPFYVIKGHSAAIQSAIQAAKKVAQTDATVLISGESGVGKELFAKAIHIASRRREKPFIAINCGAIPAALFESELFGYQGGAFTGAEKKGKPGKLELAHEGTLFLDEIGELPLELQVKLLRALQERQFYRVGGTEPITVNTRIITATNRNLEQMVADGQFREDLYYRLNVFTLEIPSLRERQEDILELVQLFLQEYSVASNQPVPRISPEVMKLLLQYKWPGNIRQLRNVMERLSILQEGGVILPDQLPSAIRLQSEEPAAPYSFVATYTEPPQPLGRNENGRTATDSEKDRILAALHRTYGNKKAAAELLQVSRGTLYNKMRKYGIADQD